jgi:hypothetical protein
MIEHPTISKLQKSKKVGFSNLYGFSLDFWIGLDFLVQSNQKIQKSNFFGFLTLNM